MGGFWTRALAACLCLMCFAAAVHAAGDDPPDGSAVVDTAVADLATRGAGRCHRLRLTSSSR